MASKLNNLLIRDTRENLRLLPIDVANEIEISLNDYRNIEDGLVIPGKDIILRICDVLKIKIEDVLDENFKETRVLCIFNAKGGVGKTVCTASLASALAVKGKRVLCVDLDSQCNLTANLNMLEENLDINEGICNIGDIFKSEAPFNQKIEDYICCTPFENIDIVLGAHDITQAVDRVASVNFKEMILNSAFKNLINSGEYDYILFDNHPGASILLSNALYTSHYAIAPLIVNEQFALDGLNDLFPIVDSCFIHNDMLKNLKILINKYDRRDNITDETYLAIKEAYPDELFNTIIRIDKQLEYACRNRSPIMYYNPKSKSADDFSKLADEVINLL